MAYIFMDESGDLGFRIGKRKGTDHFLVTFLVVSEKSPFERIIKKARERLLGKNKPKTKGNSFHATHEKSQTIRRILKAMVALGGFEIVTMVIDKSKLLEKYRQDKHFLYNKMAQNLLNKLFQRKGFPLGTDISFVASQRETNGFLNDSFQKMVIHDFQEKYGVNIDVSIKKPHEEKCLQLADIISYTFFKKYENGDERFSSIIERFLTVFEIETFP